MDIVGINCSRGGHVSTPHIHLLPLSLSFTLIHESANQAAGQINLLVSNNSIGVQVSTPYPLTYICQLGSQMTG